MPELTPELCQRARVTLDWSQKELADRAKVASKTIADFESGIISPDPRTLRDIRAALEEGGVEFLPPAETIPMGKAPLGTPARHDRDYWLGRRKDGSASQYTSRRRIR
jgi:transcriptional regulator with XRE-family HTH domain